jgi:hypothetical protein
MIPYTAYDINPVQIAQCKAKLALAQKIKTDLIQRDLRRIRIKNIETAIVSRDWFSPDVITKLLDLYHWIVRYSMDKEPDVMDILYAAFILSLRRNACITASSNPTWLKSGGTIPGTDIKDTFLQAYAFIIDWHAKSFKQKRVRNYGTVAYKDISNLTDKCCYDLCIISPPYCNRLDYKRMFAPEYLFITKHILNLPSEDKFFGNNEIKDFKTKDYAPTDYEEAVLAEVRRRQAPENKDYYFKYFMKYFSELDIILNKILGTLRSRGSAIITIQNSHYKDFTIKLDEIIKSKVNKRHGITELASKEKSYFGNLLKAKSRQKETVLIINKK